MAMQVDNQAPAPQADQQPANGLVEVTNARKQLIIAQIRGKNANMAANVRARIDDPKGSSFNEIEFAERGSQIFGNILFSLSAAGISLGSVEYVNGHIINALQHAINPNNRKGINKTAGGRSLTELVPDALLNTDLIYPCCLKLLPNGEPDIDWINNTSIKPLADQGITVRYTVGMDGQITGQHEMAVPEVIRLIQMAAFKTGEGDVKDMISMKYVAKLFQIALWPMNLTHHKTFGTNKICISPRGGAKGGLPIHHTPSNKDRTLSLGNCSRFMSSTDQLDPTMFGPLKHVQTICMWYENPESQGAYLEKCRNGIANRQCYQAASGAFHGNDGEVWQENGYLWGMPPAIQVAFSSLWKTAPNTMRKSFNGVIKLRGLQEFAGDVALEASAFGVQTYGCAFPPISFFAAAVRSSKRGEAVNTAENIAADKEELTKRLGEFYQGHVDQALNGYNRGFKAQTAAYINVYPTQDDLITAEYLASIAGIFFMPLAALSKMTGKELTTAEEREGNLRNDATLTRVSLTDNIPDYSILTIFGRDRTGERRGQIAGDGRLGAKMSAEDQESVWKAYEKGVGTFDKGDAEEKKKEYQEMMRVFDVMMIFASGGVIAGLYTVQGPEAHTYSMSLDRTKRPLAFAKKQSRKRTPVILGTSEKFNPTNDARYRPSATRLRHFLKNTGNTGISDAVVAKAVSTSPWVFINICASDREAGSDEYHRRRFALGIIAICIQAGVDAKAEMSIEGITSLIRSLRTGGLDVAGATSQLVAASVAANFVRLGKGKPDPLANNTTYANYLRTVPNAAAIAVDAGNDEAVRGAYQAMDEGQAAEIKAQQQIVTRSGNAYGTKAPMRPIAPRLYRPY